MKLKNVISQNLNGLTLVQFETQAHDLLAYTTSAKAIAQKLVEVREASQSGSVNNLVVANDSEQYVFFMDGDILAGAKQNRVLNVSILLAPKTCTTVPVSCVERGRWRYTSKSFSATDSSAPPSLRAHKSSVLAKKMMTDDYLADQAGVWAHVSMLKASSGAAAPTDDLDEVFAHKRAELEDALGRVQPAPQANGLAMFWGARLVSLDVFDRAEVLTEYLPKIVRGVLLDELVRTRTPEAPSQPDYQALLEVALQNDARTWDCRPSVGVGTERRFEAADAVGFELDYESKPVHFSLLGKQ